MSGMPEELLHQLARRDVRLGHLLWHSLRDWWARLEEAERNAFADEFVDWVPLRPSLDQWGRPVLDNGAGIDFLGAHRVMLQHYNTALRDAGLPQEQGWEAPPGVDDQFVPVPRPDGLEPQLYLSKDDAVWRECLRQTDRLLLSESLRDITLNELGTRLEYGIHAAMHERFGDYGSHRRLRQAPASVLTRVPAKWDDPGYDSLLDAYSAHVSPTFWKIHGWVDRCIAFWEDANQQRAALSDVWHGPMHGHFHDADKHQRLLAVTKLETAIGLAPALGTGSFSISLK